MKPISIQLYSLREEAASDFAAVLKTVADIGYVGVEFAGLHGMAPAAVRAIIDDLGLQVSSAHMALPTVENAAQLIDECHTLGITKLVSGFGPDQFATMDEIKASAAKFATAVEVLKGTGIDFGMHNHWWEFKPVDGQMPEDLVLDMVPGMFAEIDVYWAEVGAGNAAAAVARLAKYARLLHLKDGHIDPASPMTAVGHGKLDMPAIVGAADPNVTEWMIVELDACATDMTEAVRDSYTYLVGNGLAKGNK